MQRFNVTKGLMGLALVALLSTTAFAQEAQDAANQEARKVLQIAVAGAMECLA